MNDRELLELAAKAAGLEVDWHFQKQRDAVIDPEKASLWIVGGSTGWNPLREDGDALRLAVKLKLAIRPLDKCVFVESDPETLLGQSQFSELEMYGSDPRVATRRAIVRAAAEIGKAMP